MPPVHAKIHLSRSASSLSLIQGSTELFPALISAMDAAQHEIRLETYIFDLTGSAQDVAAALERAAQRGVKTLVLVDGVGSDPLPESWAQRLALAGVQWRVFAPLGRVGMLAPSRWRRLHRKLCCIDQQVAFCGGINILDDFYAPNHGQLDAPRFDFSVRITGALVGDVFDAMNQLWLRTTPASLAPFAALNQTSTRLRRAMDSVVQVSRKVLRPGSGALAAQHHGPAHAKLVLRDNLRHRSGIEQAYRKAISRAKSEVIIANAYFVPGRKLRRALVLAARRGVKVTLLLQGKYEYFMQFYAARPVYGALLAAGVEIHEYSASFLHAKVAVVDGHWATVGSSNLDPLSLLLAREANVSVQDHVFAQSLRERLVSAIAHQGRRMDPADYAHRPLRQRCLEWVAYALMRVALMLQGRKYL